MARLITKLVQTMDTELAGKSILTFDGACDHCSALARYVDDLHLEQVIVRPRSHEGVEALLAQLRCVPDPRRPFAIDTRGVPVVLTGVKLRWRLAAELGVGRSSVALKLLAREAEARSRRAAERSLNRRSVVVGVGATALGGIFSTFLGRTPAAAAPLTPTMIGETAAHKVASILGMSASTRAFGPIDYASTYTFDAPELGVCVAFSHPSSGTTTFATQSGERTVIAFRPPQAVGEPLRYFDEAGTALASVLIKDGEPYVLENDLGDTTSKTPLGFILCFRGCIGMAVSTDCIDSCYKAATSGSVLGWVIARGGCAGANALKCAKQCR